MPDFKGLFQKPTPDWEAFLRTIRREGTPVRAHNIELFLETEYITTIRERFGVGSELCPADPFFTNKLRLAVLRFLNFDYVYAYPEGFMWPFNSAGTADTPGEMRSSRSFMEEHRGPITTWEEFEKFPWPDPNLPGAMTHFEWLEKNLPDDMCIVGGGLGNFCEYLCWLPGYEKLCYLLYDDRKLVRAIADRIAEFFKIVAARMLQFPRVKVLFPTDDMGFKSHTLVSPDDLREFVLPGHTAITKMAHDAGRLCVLHSCGMLGGVWDDLIDDCKLDGLHSFEDTIDDVRDLKKAYGSKVALLGGIDVDFLCRASEAEIRKRVRNTLEVCSPGGGYLLGTGSSPAPYMPLDNYLTMIDEGRRWRP